MSSEKQLSRLIYHYALSTMKNTLNLEELSYRESGRDDPRYKTFKKHLMEFTYNNLRDLFEDLEEFGLLVPTEYDEDVKDGYVDNLSGGSSYINSEKLDNILQ